MKNLCIRGTFIMNNKHVLLIVIVTILILALSAFTYNALQPTGQIYLYGEKHSVEKILEKELELWNAYYHDEGLRHLFIEAPYYTAELLNVWMKADNNVILDEINNDWAGTPAGILVKAFYEKIKNQCPETIFHGTDVGHQFETIGVLYLEYLESNHLTDTEQYRITLEVIKQGAHFYESLDDAYRENMMAENFKREFDALSNESIMGIYGAAHTGLDAIGFSSTVPCMANQLEDYYGDRIHSEDLTGLAKDSYPFRVDTINVKGKAYTASYFGKRYMPANEGYAYVEFWRLEDAYDDFKDFPITDDVLTYNDYPMLIEYGSIYVVDYLNSDGPVSRKYYRSDDKIWSSSTETVECKIE